MAVLWRCLTLRSIFPVIDQLQEYSIHVFKYDLLSAATVVCVLLPQVIGCATLATISLKQAIVSAIYPLIIYFLFGASKNLSVGPEAITSLMTGVVVSYHFEKYGGSRDKIASSFGLLVGIASIFLAIIKAGFIDRILQGFMLDGIIIAIASLIIIDQIPSLMGLPRLPFAGELSAFQKLRNIMNSFHLSHVTTLIFGLVSILLLVSLQMWKRYKNGKWLYLPDLIIYATICTGLSYSLDFFSLGIDLLGDEPVSIWISPRLPDLTTTSILEMIPDVFIVTFVGFIQCQIVTRKPNVEGK